MDGFDDCCVACIDCGGCVCGDSSCIGCTVGNGGGFGISLGGYGHGKIKLSGCCCFPSKMLYILSGSTMYSLVSLMKI